MYLSYLLDSAAPTVFESNIDIDIVLIAILISFAVAVTILVIIKLVNKGKEVKKWKKL